MAMNRYGRIYHSDHHYNTLRFPSADARSEFVEKFDKHHASHDHDGEVPRFENVTAAEANKVKVHDASDATIDGYAAHEIYAYHERDDDRYVHYHPPTTIAPLIIVIKRNGEFIDSSTLTRHELSEIFMDMPDEDFQNLLKSVERDGFKDPIIRMIDTQVLDGWHRYRAAKELNLLRKLRFQQWKEQDEGDPAAFAYARNMGRRHQSPSVRAQIAVTFNKRFGHGTNRFTLDSPNGDSKTRKELAKEVGVSERTIDRAIKVDKAGRGDEVTREGKSASEIIDEITVEALWKQITPAISEWKQAREGVGNASKSMFIKATLRWEGLPSDTETDVKVLKILLNLLTTEETNVLEELIRKQLGGKSLWGDASVDAETDEKKTEQPSQTDEEREANKLLKQKKQAIKGIWDKRKQAARDWLGTEDNDLTTYTDLDALEKAFIAYEDHAYCADAFQSGMRRTAEQTFNICLEKTLASDVSLETLEAEYKAVSTYALDILQWKQQEWIQQLIDKKRKKTEAAETPSESADSEIDVDAIQRDIVKAREKADAEGGMVSFRPIANKYGIDAEEVGRIASGIQGASQPSKTAEEAEAEKLAVELECAHGNAENDRRRVWIAFDESELSKSISKEDFALAAAKQHGLYEDSYGSGENYLLAEDYAPINKLSLKEAQEMRAFFNSVETAIRESADWVTALETTEEGTDGVSNTAEPTEAEDSLTLDDRMSHLRSDLINNHWLHQYSWEGIDVRLFAEQYGIETGVIEGVQKEIAAEYPNPAPEPLADLNGKEEGSEKTLSDVLGEDRLAFITVCLREPEPTGVSGKGRLNYITFDAEDDRMRPCIDISEIPEPLLAQLIAIAKEAEKTDATEKSLETDQEPS